ncbi:hypothetical protein EV702DRAFT_1203989 [Suillus placidus]|uniref:Uncharacterized protein n=1 Tax=Suillus placidus TaxID=48579 RepID=A0A9P6ZHY9_9AGAM|nr:hypothetical protein EV702DRAFT_1203989 [Suillus placidus]
MSMRKRRPAEVNTITRLIFKASYYFSFTIARAVDRKANEPRQTLVGSLWKPTIHESVASRQPVIKRTENPGGGFLFEDAVHEKIVDS